MNTSPTNEATTRLENVRRFATDPGNLGPRFESLMKALGGWRSLPGIATEDLVRVSELTHTDLTPAVRAEWLALTSLIRRRVATSLGLTPVRDVDGSDELVDHALGFKDSNGRTFVWSSPYIDNQGILHDAEPMADARRYVERMREHLAARGVQAVVLGRGSYHPAAVDLLIWSATAPRPGWAMEVAPAA